MTTDCREIVQRRYVSSRLILRAMSLIKAVDTVVRILSDDL